jgi:ABC-type polysaccharide/polyol phosphate export permease
LTAVPRHYASARNSLGDELRATGTDFTSSLRMSQLWFTLGNNDIVSRYRGSVLGPFWITLTTLTFIVGIGILYAGIMKTPVDQYLPLVATGIVIWNFINQMILDGADTFVAVSHILRQTAIPLPLFIWRSTWRNILIFAHQLPVLIAVALWFHYLLRINFLGAALGFVLIIFNVTWFSFLAAIICARFRDLQQVLASSMQLLFFISPVIWVAKDGAGYSNIMKINPILHMLNVTRNPMLGKPIDVNSIVFLVILAMLGWSATFFLFASVRRRIVHYV